MAIELRTDERDEDAQDGATSSAAAAVYAEREARFGAERTALLRQWNRTANLRLVFALLAFGCLIWALWSTATIAWLATALFALIFVVLMGYHSRLARRRRRAEELWALTVEAAHREAHDWDAIPIRHATAASPEHPYAVDLDIVGRASLSQLLEAARTPTGDAQLAGWLLAPAAPETVRDRQAAVAELSPRLDLRDDVALAVRLMGQPAPDPVPFLRWAEGEPWLAGRRGLLWAARLSAVLLCVTGALWLLDVLAYPLWVPFLASNIILAVALGGRARQILQPLWQQQRAFGHYAAAFDVIAAATFDAEPLRRLRERLVADGATAGEQMRRLNWRTAFAIPPSAMFYWPIQILTLWDLHLLDAVERWQRAHGPRARGWLDALGEFEALSALATLAHDNPDWAYPDLDDEAAAFDARALAHPLLSRATRIANDVTVGPPGTFLLVTGSNMSGKSTLLRAIGLNAVLAGAGGPVCAAALRLPPVRLWTSMRVTDSLELGVSYFMAELQRLKALVDAARANEDEGGRTFLYLIDEMLQGTNTRERQVAARRIVGHFLRLRAVGAVSTHDLDMADSAELRTAAAPIYFTESVSSGADGPAMTFDYTARPGIATSTNALRLMEIVGLDVE